MNGQIGHTKRLLQTAARLVKQAEAMEGSDDYTAAIQMAYKATYIAGYLTRMHIKAIEAGSDGKEAIAIGNAAQQAIEMQASLWGLVSANIDAINSLSEDE